MSESQEVKSMFQAMVESGNVRYTVQPAAAAPTLLVSDAAAAAWAWAAYVQVVAAAVLPNPCWICGIFVSTPTVEAFQSDIAIATGAGGAETDLAIVSATTELFAVVEGKSLWIPLPYPIKVIGTPRLALRIRKSSAASAAGWSVKVSIAAAVGS
jgi:hypothetical protein